MESHDQNFVRKLGSCSQVLEGKESNLRAEMARIRVATAVVFCVCLMLFVLWMMVVGCTFVGHPGCLAIVNPITVMISVIFGVCFNTLMTNIFGPRIVRETPV